MSTRCQPLSSLFADGDGRASFQNWRSFRKAKRERCGSRGMYMPAPQECQPDIGIKEIQRVHRSAHSSGLLVVLWKQSEEIQPALASAAVSPRPPVSHREEPVHESKNQFPPPVPLISGKGAPECPPSSESILAS